MHKEAISSVAVIDNQSNVAGNISAVDIRVRTHGYSKVNLLLTCSIASHALNIIPSFAGYVSPFHQCHLIHAWSG